MIPFYCLYFYIPFSLISIALTQQQTWAKTIFFPIFLLTFSFIFFSLGTICILFKPLIFILFGIQVTIIACIIIIRWRPLLVTLVNNLIFVYHSSSTWIYFKKAKRKYKFRSFDVISSTHTKKTYFFFAFIVFHSMEWNANFVVHQQWRFVYFSTCIHRWHNKTII